MLRNAETGSRPATTSFVAHPLFDVMLAVIAIQAARAEV